MLDPGAPRYRTAGAVEHRAVEADPVGHQLAGLAIDLQGGRAAAGVAVVRLGRVAERREVDGLLVVAHQPHGRGRVVEAGHAVLAPGREDAVAHEIARGPEGPVDVAGRQRQACGHAVGQVHDRSKRPDRAQWVGVRGMGQEALERPSQGQRAAVPTPPFRNVRRSTPTVPRTPMTCSRARCAEP